MKKAISTILALIFVLSLCGSAFAADDNLTMTYSTSVVNGARVNIFQYRDAEGRLIREETDTLGSKGQLTEKNISIYNEAGQRVSQRIRCMEDNGGWKDDETVWTYNSDGSEVMDSRVVFTKPDNTQEFRIIQTKTDADGKSVGRGEGRDVNGNKLYDLSLEYEVIDSNRIETVKYSYPDGTASTESTTRYTDGTEIFHVVNDNASGQIVKETVFQDNPDGSYDRTSVSNTYRDNGKVFTAQTNESLDADGNYRKESVSYTVDEKGFGSGKGILTEGDGRRAVVEIEYRNDEEEGKVCASTYRYSDGTIDLKYVVTSPDGETTTTYERDVKNYGDSDSENYDEAVVEDEEDPFDAWDEAFSDWYEGELPYIGDPTALESDIEYDYYDTGVEWGDESDWGGASDWSDVGDFGGWDDASGWE